ncbi:MAG: ribonuclease HII [Bacteroidetes bacterium]|nr:MAG: ribonuclease HII [Bacteroidota bacterium]
MLLSFHTRGIIEAGCDEAGRGCLAGSVFAAAVILPSDFKDELLNDSKKLNEKQRYLLRDLIEKKALSWAVAQVDQEEIDEINILNASFLAMHRAIEKLQITPESLLIDGPRFNPYKQIPFHCIIKGDGKYLSIAAASILAKTYRDDYMKKAHQQFPVYGWDRNKGYPTLAHKLAIQKHGLNPLHRKTFNYHLQLKLDF